MKIPRDQLARAAAKVVGIPRPRALRRYVRLALDKLISKGLSSRMSYGDDASIKFTLTRKPYRVDESVALDGRKDSTKGWWAARVRSSFGGISVLLYTPGTGMVEGFVWLR